MKLLICDDDILTVDVIQSQLNYSELGITQILRAYNGAVAKEIIARENEISALRKTEPEKAYYGCHTDITLPYDELGCLYGVTETGEEIPVIKDGLFVLPGTEALNEALEQQTV